MSSDDRHRSPRPRPEPRTRAALDGDELGAVADSLFAAPVPPAEPPPGEPPRAEPPPGEPLRAEPPPGEPELESVRTSAPARRRASPHVAVLRERASDWLMLAGAGLLVISLFLTWSHQLSPALRHALAGTGALRGVPANPDAWQVYSVAEALLAVLALALAGLALAGSRRARLLAIPFVALGLTFVAHAVAHPPTDGTDLVAGALSPVRYAPNPVTSGPGEPLALLALGAALLGIAISPSDPVA